MRTYGPWETPFDFRCAEGRRAAAGPADHPDLLGRHPADEFAGHRPGHLPAALFRQPSGRQPDRGGLRLLRCAAHRRAGRSGARADDGPHPDLPWPLSAVAAHRRADPDAGGLSAVHGADGHIAGLSDRLATVHVSRHVDHRAIPHSLGLDLGRRLSRALAPVRGYHHGQRRRIGGGAGHPDARQALSSGRPGRGPDHGLAHDLPDPHRHRPGGVAHPRARRRRCPHHPAVRLQRLFGADQKAGHDPPDPGPGLPDAQSRLDERALPLLLQGRARLHHRHGLGPARRLRPGRGGRGADHHLGLVQDRQAPHADVDHLGLFDRPVRGHRHTQGRQPARRHSGDALVRRHGLGLQPFDPVHDRRRGRRGEARAG